MGFAQAHQTIASSINLLTPNPPRWVGLAMLAAGGMAAVADFILERQGRRAAPGQEDIYRALAAYYHRAAAEEQTRRQSHYLREEGARPETDCYACASAHLAAIEGAVSRAQEIAARDEGCTADCAAWLEVAAEEAAALLARDWTAQRIDRLPTPTRTTIAGLAKQVDNLLHQLLPEEDRRMVLAAAAELTESVRFARAGDTLGHPEVEARLSSAERWLATAERRDPAVWEAEAGEWLRRLRRQVGTISGPDELARAARQARELSARLNRRAWSALGAGDLLRIRRSAEDLRRRYRAARRGEE